MSSATSDSVVAPLAEADDVPAPARMAELLGGFELSRALYVVAKLDIASALTGCHSDSLRRLVRTLSGVGVFTRRDGDVVALTPFGATLAASS